MHDTAKPSAVGTNRNKVQASKPHHVSRGIEPRAAPCLQGNRTPSCTMLKGNRTPSRTMSPGDSNPKPHHVSRGIEPQLVWPKNLARKSAMCTSNNAVVRLGGICITSHETPRQKGQQKLHLYKKRIGMNAGASPACMTQQSPRQLAPTATNFKPPSHTMFPGESNPELHHVSKGIEPQAAPCLQRN